MTREEVEELITDCPILYHMAEEGSWPSIRERGLLSTTALLDLYEIKGEARIKVEECRRPAGIPLVHPRLPRAVVRDQIPMDDRGLKRCLPPYMTPADWYRLLNGKVFFWMTRERLLRLLKAGAYRAKRHDVIEIATRPLFDAYFENIWLCPMNSGCTKPFPHPRDQKTFLRVQDYPYAHWRRKRRRGERVVELAVDYGVPDVLKFVTRVLKMRGEEESRPLYLARRSRHA